MVFSLLLLLASVAAVELRTTDGGTVTGTPVSLSESHVVLREGGRERTFETDQLQSIRFPASVPVDTEGSLGLHDGTLIGFQQLEMPEGGSSVRVSHRFAGQLELPLEQIDWIRFQTPRAAINARWQEFVEQERPSDLLVIRRPGNVLDRVSGIVLGIEQSQVLFDLEGERIAAPRDRLEGLIFRDARDQPEAKQPVARLTDISGSRWSVAMMSLQQPPDGGSDAAVLRLETTRGQSLSLQLDQVVEISFASGAVDLDRLTPVRATVTPFHDLGLPAELTAALIGPQRVDGTAEGSGASAAIVMTGRSSLEYRVPEGARQLTARITMPRPGDQPVQLRILLDGKEALSLPLDARRPQHRVELDVSGARRLLLEYDGFSAAGVGDRILIENARMNQ